MKKLAGILLFLIALVLCTFFARFFHQDAIEKDLEQKVSQVLKKHGLDPTGVEVSNHHLTQIGQLPASSSASEELVQDLDSIIGLYVDADKLTPTPSTAPHFRLAEKANQSIFLTGTVKDEDEKAYLVDLAATPPQKGGTPRIVVDALEVSDKVASIGPKEKISQLAPSLLSSAEEGFFDWSPTKLKMGGLLESKTQRSDLLAAASGLTSGDTSPLDEFQVQPLQDLDFGVERKHTEIVVTGTLPDSQTRDSLLTLVEREAKGIAVTDKTTLAVRPKKRWWQDHSTSFVPSFLSNTKGLVRLHYYPDRFIAEGTFPKEADFNLAHEKIGDFPANIKQELALNFAGKPTADPIFKMTTPIPETENPARKPAKIATPSTETKVVPTPTTKAVPTPTTKAVPTPTTKAVPTPTTKAAPTPAPVDAEKLATQLKPLAVYFDSASFAIKASESAKIDQAAQIILTTNNVTHGLTIGGYADLKGNAAYNRRLSLNRAKAVRDRLIKKGVPTERLTLKHFGEDTSKTARADLWKSRRVEISLTQPSN